MAVFNLPLLLNHDEIFLDNWSAYNGKLVTSAVSCTLILGTISQPIIARHTAIMPNTIRQASPLFIFLFSSHATGTLMINTSITANNTSINTCTILNNNQSSTISKAAWVRAFLMVLYKVSFCSLAIVS